MGIGPAQRDDHQERRQDEGDTDERGAEHAVVNVAEINAELCGERPGHHLS